jgi:hypothetical protein
MESLHPGVGSSGVSHMPQKPDTDPRIPVRLFSSPPSTPLDGIHDKHPQASTQPSSGGGDRDEPHDVYYMVAFLGVRHVTNTRTLPVTSCSTNHIYTLTYSLRTLASK